MKQPIAFAGSPLDRAENQRRDHRWIATQLQREESRFLPVWRLQVLVKTAAPALAWARAVVCESMNREVGPVLLGLRDGVAHFAVDLSAVEEPLATLGAEGVAEFHDVRAAAATLPGEDAAIAAHARARIDWHGRHGFCPGCGAATRSVAGGSHRLCPDCSTEHFPRTDPVAIAVVCRGDHCLLGRQRGWPAGMFSALAGFVEAAETLEEAVRREVAEETGVPVGRVRYVGSQPWPFPSSLMLGCIAEGLAEDVSVDAVELEDARWFDRATVRRALAGDPDAGLVVPPPLAIAHHLLREWVSEGAPE